MRNFFPSTFPPKKMWRAFYPWEQSRVILGQGQGNRVSNSLFQNTSVGYVHLTEMHFKIPHVVVLCPWRSYLIESYWSHPYWLTCPPPWCFPQWYRRPWFLPQANCSVALWFCSSAVRVLVVLPLQLRQVLPIKSHTLCRVRSSVFGFQFWVSWFLAQASCSVSTRLYIKLWVSLGEVGRLQGTSWVVFPRWVHPGLRSGTWRGKLRNQGRLLAY